MYTSGLGASAMDVRGADGLIRRSLFSKVTRNISTFGQTMQHQTHAAHTGTIGDIVVSRTLQRARLYLQVYIDLGSREI